VFVRNNIVYLCNGNIQNYNGSGTTQDHNLVGVNPLFVNAGAGDFHLQAGSPAIDAGTSLPQVTDDFEGNPRPQNSVYDIGAFEYTP
jgi:hypothetical protein